MGVVVNGLSKVDVGEALRRRFRDAITGRPCPGVRWGRVYFYRSFRFYGEKLLRRGIRGVQYLAVESGRSVVHDW